MECQAYVGQDYATDEAFPLPPAPWISLSFTTWAMDMIFAVVCGLGLFHVLIYFFRFTSSSPALGTTTTNKKVVKRDHIKARKKIRTLKAYRPYSRKKEKDYKFLLSLLQNMLGKLTDTISFCQLLRRDASAEVSKPEAVKDHQPPRRFTPKSTATKLPLVASLPLLKEHLLPKDLTLTPVLRNSPASKESKSFTCASRPPVALIPPSPAPCGPPSLPRPPNPMLCSPSQTDPSMTPSPPPPLPPPPPPPPLPPPPPPPPPPLPPPPLQRDWKTQLVTSHSTPLPGLPSPIPTTAGHELSNRPISRLSWYKETWCHSNSWHGDTLQEDLPLSFREASFWADPIYRQIEAGEPTFINPDVQEMLELQISKRVELKLWEGKGKERSDHVVSFVGDMLQSWSRNRATTCKPEQLSGHQQLLDQKVFRNNIHQSCRQLFWGLPFLHSESIMATVGIVAGSPLDAPSILFNGLSTYHSIQVERNAPPQLFSPKPLLQHFVESQPLTSEVSWPCSPPGSGIKTQACDPPSIPSLPPHPTPTEDYRASCPTDSRSPFIVPLPVQRLERYLLKKYQESRSDLPDIVKKSQEIFNQLTSDSLASQGQGSVTHLLEEFANPELEGQLEQHLKTSCGKHEGRTIQLSPDLIKSEDKLPGVGHAEGNQGSSCSSELAGRSSQHPQRLSSKGPESFQIEKDPCRDPTNSPGGSLRDLHKTEEGSLDEVLETISATEVASGCVRQPRSVSPSPQPGAPGQEQPQELLTNHGGSESGSYDDRTVPVGTCHGIPVDHAVVPPENSETHMENSERHTENSESHMENSESHIENSQTHMEENSETHMENSESHIENSQTHMEENSETHMENSQIRMEENSETNMEENSERHMENSETNFENPETNIETQKQTSLNNASTFKDTSTGLSFLDPCTQQVLETHLTRHLVRHRWALPLRGLKTIHIFNVNKPVALPFLQPPTSSWSCQDSRDDSIVKTASILGGPFQKDSEEDLTTKTASGIETPPTALNLEFPNGTPPNDNLWPSEAPSAVQKDSVASLCTTHSLEGRDRLSDRVLVPWNDSPELGSNLIKNGDEPQKSEGVAVGLSHGLSVQEITAASQLATNRDTREREEEGSCDWTLDTETREMASFRTEGHLKDVESRQAREGQSPSRTISQDLEDSATGVILQDLATGMFFEDCSPEVLLAADILASQPWSTTSKTCCKDMYPFLSRGGKIPKNPRSEKPWTSHILGPVDKKEDGRGPRQDIDLLDMSAAQAYRSDHESNSSPLTEKTFGGRMKSYMKNFMSVITTKSQAQENSLQKGKASAATPQSQGSVMSRVFMPSQLAEAQDLMASVGPSLQEKVGVGPARTASKKTLHKEPPQVPVGRHVCLHRSAIGERDKAHRNNPKVHSQPSTDKWTDYHSQAQLCREAVTRANACQHRVQPPCVPGTPVHCPRHCLCRSELSRKAKAFPYLP